MSIVPITAEYAEQAGQIAYEAFKDIAEKHGFDPAFPSPEFATLVVRLLIQTESVNSYLYLDGGEPAAINFGDERDEVVGVGPVAVALKHQGKGLGRAVMEALLESAERGGFRSVRLLQAAYNMISFSLYAALGFEVKDTLANFAGSPGSGEAPVDHVRDGGAEDFDALDALCRQVLHYSRRHDIERMAMFAPPVVVERQGRIVAYACRFPGEEAVLGHGVAVDAQAMRDLLIGAHRIAGTPLRFSMPVSQAETVRWCLATGMRLKEIDTYMVRGDYEPPAGLWFPSAFY